jgi:hypothetical protein
MTVVSEPFRPFVQGKPGTKATSVYVRCGCERIMMIKLNREKPVVCPRCSKTCHMDELRK